MKCQEMHGHCLKQIGHDRDDSQRPEDFSLSVSDKPAGTRWGKEDIESLEMEVGLDFGVGVETVSRMKWFFVGDYAADYIEAVDM